MIGYIYEPRQKRFSELSSYVTALTEAKRRTIENPRLTLEIGGVGSRGAYSIRTVHGGQIVSVATGYYLNPPKPKKHNCANCLTINVKTPAVHEDKWMGWFCNQCWAMLNTEPLKESDLLVSTEDFMENRWN